MAKGAEIWVAKQPDGSLAALAEQDAERLARFKIGVPFKITAVKPRNPKHHRLGMGMLQWVFENQEMYDTFEDLLLEVKLRTGHYREHITARGKVVYVPKSIAFENMDEIEFGEWRSKAVNVVLKYFLPQMTHLEFEGVMNRILSYS